MNDEYLNEGNPCEYEEKNYECPECASPVDEDGEYCGRKCWLASMI